MVNGVGTKTSRRAIERLLSISKLLKCGAGGGVPCLGFPNSERAVKIESEGEEGVAGCAHGESGDDADNNIMVVDTMWREMSFVLGESSHRARRGYSDAKNGR